MGALGKREPVAQPLFEAVFHLILKAPSERGFKCLRWTLKIYCEAQVLNALKAKRNLRVNLFEGALGGGSLLFAAIMLVNVLNYGYAVALGRFLGPESYGSYASFISLILLVSLLPLTVQQVTAKYAAANKSVLSSALKQSLILGSLLGLSLALSANWLAPLINLPVAWLVGLGVALPVYALIGALRGEVQGQQRLAHLGGNMVLEHAAKIILTPLVFLGLANASGAVLATLSAWPLVAVNLRKVWRRKQIKIQGATVSEARRYAVPVFLGLAAQALLINSDVLLANALLSEAQAGLYAATSLVGRVVFYASWAVSVVLFPMVAARGAKGEGHLRLLYLGLAATAVMCSGAVAFCALWPQTVVTLLFGKAYVAAASLIAPYALMTSLYALANIVSNHYLALGRSAAGYIPLVAAAAQLLLIGAFHTGPLEIIWIQALAKGGLLVLLVGTAALGLFKPSRGDKHVLR